MGAVGGTTKRKAKPRRNKKSAHQIKEMVEETNGLYGSIITTEGENLKKAVIIGGHLVELKKQFPHGKWITWRRENFDFSDRTAGRYVKLFEYKDIVKNAKSIRQAIRIVEALEERPSSVIEPTADNADKNGTCACFTITVTKDSPKKMVDDCFHKYSFVHGVEDGKKFLTDVADCIQRVDEQSAQDD